MKEIKTIGEALKETKRQARMCYMDYSTYKDYQADARRRNKQRKAVLQFIDENGIDLDTPLKQGQSINGRCRYESKKHDIYGQGFMFIVGFYSVVEVYGHFLSYLEENYKGGQND